MRVKAFGATGVMVPAVGQGTWPLPDARALRHGIALGMTHIDTAEMYGSGTSERIVGDAIRGVPRDTLFIVTKVLPEHADAAGVRRACEASLGRLRLEHVDCFLIHWRGDVPIEETMGALEELVVDGKARSIGVSNFDTWDLREASRALRTQSIACDQVLYNLRERTIEDHELPWCATNDCALVAYTPLGRPTMDPQSRRHRVLGQIAAQHRVTAHAVALAFLIRHPSVFAIPKANAIEHVEANAKAGELILTDAEIAAIDAAYPKRERTGPLPTN